MNWSLFLLFMFYLCLEYIHCDPPTESDLEYVPIYGVPIDSGGEDGAYDNMPSYGERYMHHYQNIVRVDKNSYRDLGYATAGYPANYPDLGQVKAIWFHPRLIQVARVQGKDLNDNGPCPSLLQHDSCDGTSAGDRVREYFPCGYTGENGAWNYGYSAVNDGWLCEGSTSSCYEGGHTRNIMSSSHSMCGIGQFNAFIFQDCSACTALYTPETHPIPSGVHIVQVSGESNEVKLMAFFRKYAGDTDVEAYVAVTNEYVAEKLVMDQEFGNSELGYHYTVTIPAQTEMCRGYWFMFKYEGGSFEYPMDGMILIHNEGADCTDEEGNERYFDEARMVLWEWTDSAESLIVSSFSFLFVVVALFL